MLPARHILYRRCTCRNPAGNQQQPTGIQLHAQRLVSSAACQAAAITASAMNRCGRCRHCRCSGGIPAGFWLPLAVAAALAALSLVQGQAAAQTVNNVPELDSGFFTQVANSNGGIVSASREPSEAADDNGGAIHGCAVVGPAAFPVIQARFSVLSTGQASLRSPLHCRMVPAGVPFQTDAQHVPSMPACAGLWSQTWRGNRCFIHRRVPSLVLLQRLHESTL